MSTLHLAFLKDALDAILALGTLKAYPMATTYTPDATNDQYFDDISADVASGAAGITLGTVTTTIDGANSRVELDTADFSDDPVTFTSDKYCLVVDTGTPGTSPVLATIDYTDGTLSPFSSEFAITVDANGHFALNAA